MHEGTVSSLDGKVAVITGGLGAIGLSAPDGAARAMRVLERGATLEALRHEFAAQEEPEAPPGHAVVRVRATAVNPSDVKAALGLMPQAVWPRTPGRDFAGTVVAGPGAWIGRDVFGSGGDLGITRDGAHARFLVLPEGALRACPANLSMDEAGALGVPFVTAIEGFRRAGGVHTGQTVLVLGANGKVGQAAVQIAAQTGARVLAAHRKVGPFEGRTRAEVEAIDAREGVATAVRELTSGRGADVVFNTVGSAYFAEANAAMAKGAVQIFIATNSREVPFDIFAFYRGMHTYVGIDSLALDAVASAERLDGLRDGFERGELAPFPGARTYPLAHALAAYSLVLSGSSERIVLRP